MATPKIIRGPYKRKPLAERFWAKVDKRGKDECWNWTAGVFTSGGYGHLGEGGKYGRALRAHVISWEMHNGPIENGLFVLHQCDNPLCVNPNHLFLGTQTQNMADMHAKKRHVFGERHKRAKLVPADIHHMRKRRASNWSMQAIADEFGVSKSLVSKIIRGEKWRHL